MTNPPDIVVQLVERFEEHHDAYRSGRYNETQLRREFLDPFFDALGWDVANRGGVAEGYKEVIHEDRLETEWGTKAPDYCFYLGGERKFFVEAKKPAVNIYEGIHPAYQLRRYAWSAKLPLSILTDFEELAVYDCLSMPTQNDHAGVGRYKFLTYRDYLLNWDLVSGLFSREAVAHGSLDQFADSSKTKHGTNAVDAAFLSEIERWRKLLAHNIAQLNPVMTQRDLNYAVQMTIDRIIFLRICEDRGIESYGQLQGLGSSTGIYSQMCDLFRRADQRFDSGLFHFSVEKGETESPDGLTLEMQVGDAPLKQILENVYYPKSPYEFSVFSADILGQVYEQFLGKVIHLTSSHDAEVEDKPEVKKAGGVFYTPTYIVDYIVKNTVGKLLEGRKPGGVGVGRGEPLRLLDPSCGSGSFLLGAYQYLLDWYLGGYSADAEKWSKGRTPTIYQTQDGIWKLTTAERKRILLDHIYGVDLDQQAVEVTKLSLLLKVLEGENERTLGRQLSLLQERALPNLGKNIKCGNSLIGPNFYDEQLMFFDEDEQYRINVFDWKKNFRQVFLGSGGFDAIIGNPPYIRIQVMKEWAPVEVEFYKEAYRSASRGNYDIYVVFVEKGLSLLNERGILGFILPNKFFNAKYGEALRGLISTSKNIYKIVYFGAQQVFENATTYTCLLFLTKSANSNFHFEKVTDLSLWQSGKSGEIGQLPAPQSSTDVWNFTVGSGISLIDKFSQMPHKLENLAKRIFQGLKTGADPVYILEERESGRLFSNALNSEIEIESIFLRPLYKSGNMKRYRLLQNTRYVIFPYRGGKLISWEEIQGTAPKTAKYLLDCRNILAKRENGRWEGDQWYCYSRTQALEIISSTKILTADLNPYANYCLDEDGRACFPGGAAGGYGIVVEEDLYLYILGLLNSKAVDYYHKSISQSFRGGWFGYDAKIIRNIPIRKIDFSDRSDLQKFDHMKYLVKNVIDLERIKLQSNTPNEETMLQHQIEAIEHQIDRVVYDLYKMTEEEIKIVEGEE